MAEIFRIWLQIAATLSASISMYNVGLSAVWPSPSYPKLVHAFEKNITSSQWAWTISVSGVGSFLTPIPAGYLVNKVGRKPILLTTGPLFVISWTIIAFANSVLMLVISRAIGGFATGIVFGVCPIYVAEIAQDNIRAILGTVMVVMFNTGQVFELSLGPYVCHKMLGLLNAVFPVVFFVTFIFMPETPCYQIIRNHRDKAKATLKRLRGKDDVEEELDNLEEEVHEEMKNKGGPRDLVSTRGTRKALVIMFGLVIIQQFGGIMAVMSNAQTIFSESHSATDPRISAIIIGAISLIAAAVASFVVEMSGQKSLLLLSTSGCFLSLFILGTYQFFTIKLEKDSSCCDWIPLFSLIFYILTYNLGIGCIPIGYFGEIFPANIKGLAVGIASMSLSAAFLTVVKLYQIVADHIGVYVTFWGFSAVSLGGVFFIYFLVLETKGKSLEQIIAELSGEKYLSHHEFTTTVAGDTEETPSTTDAQINSLA